MNGHSLCQLQVWGSVVLMSLGLMSLSLCVLIVRLMGWGLGEVGEELAGLVHGASEEPRPPRFVPWRGSFSQPDPGSCDLIPSPHLKGSLRRRCLMREAGCWALPLRPCSPGQWTSQVPPQEGQWLGDSDMPSAGEGPEWTYLLEQATTSTWQSLSSCSQHIHPSTPQTATEGVSKGAPPECGAEACGGREGCWWGRMGGREEGAREGRSTAVLASGPSRDS